MHFTRSTLARRFASLALVFALAMTGGCFGRFPTTRAIYRFNDHLSENEFWESAAFWGLTFGLVYPYAFLADTLVLNPIEFWTGSTLEISQTKTTARKPSAVESRDGGPARWSAAPALSVQYAPPAEKPKDRP